MRGDYQQCCLSTRSADGGFLVVAVIKGVAYCWFYFWCLLMKKLTSGRLLYRLCRLDVDICNCLFFLLVDWCSPGMLSWLSEATSLIALSFWGLCWWFGGDLPSTFVAVWLCYCSLDRMGDPVLTTESWKNLGLKVVLDFYNLAGPLSELVLWLFFMKGLCPLDSWFRMLDELFDSVFGGAW